MFLFVINKQYNPPPNTTEVDQNPPPPPRATPQILHESPHNLPQPTANQTPHRNWPKTHPATQPARNPAFSTSPPIVLPTVIHRLPPTTIHPPLATTHPSSPHPHPHRQPQITKHSTKSIPVTHKTKTKFCPRSDQWSRA